MSDTDEITKSQKANLIDDEIKKGESDEKSIKSPAKNNNSPLYSKTYVSNAKKIMNDRRDKLCREKLYAREAAQAPKTIKVLVYPKPGSLPKRNYIPRHCLTKEEWMTLISTPNRKSSLHFKGIEEKTLKAIPIRINELAKPPRQRMVATLKDRGAILPTSLVDRLITVLEAESSLTPEQVEEFFRIERRGKKRKEQKSRLRKRSVRAETQLTLDKDAKICQYAMAEAFLKSILEWECTIPKKEFEDITQVIFNRLRQLFDLTSVDKDARRIQQMYFLADIIAAWIAGVLCEVAQLREDELKKYCDKIRKAPEGNTDDYDEEDDDNDDDDNEDNDNEDNDNNDENEDNDENDENDDNDNNDNDDNDNNDNDDNDDNDESDDNDENDENDDNDENDENEDNDHNDNDDNDNNDNDDNDNNGIDDNNDADDNDNNENDDDDAYSTDSDRNGNEDHHYDNNEYNNGDQIGENQNEDKFYEQTNKEEALKMSVENTIGPVNEILAKIHSNVINETVVDDIVGSKISSVIDADRWYWLPKKVGSESFIRRQFHSNAINQKYENHTIFIEPDLSKSGKQNASYSIVEREINPNC